MIVLGLTGSIGMGKTTTAGILHQLGLPVHDADATVHKLLGKGGEAVPFVAAAFPEVYDKKKKNIDRRKLGTIVFTDSGEKEVLEGILHPLVIKQQKRFLLAVKNSGARIAVLDVPLLFETGVDSLCDYTLCVTAPYLIQKQRVLSRSGMTEEKFLDRLSNQLPDMEKRQMSDFVVQTGLGRAYTYRQLRSIVSGLVGGSREYARNSA